MPKKADHKQIIEDLRVCANPKRVARVHGVSLSTVYRVMKRAGFNLTLARHVVRMRDEQNVNVRPGIIKGLVLEGEHPQAVANAMGVSLQYVHEVSSELPVVKEAASLLRKMGGPPWA